MLILRYFTLNIHLKSHGNISKRLFYAFRFDNDIVINIIHYCDVKTEMFNNSIDRSFKIIIIKCNDIIVIVT